MLPEKQSPFTFIVRLWPEKSNGGQSVWRGSVEHVQSGERAYFQDIERLKEVLLCLVGDMFKEKGDEVEE